VARPDGINVATIPPSREKFIPLEGWPDLGIEKTTSPTNPKDIVQSMFGTLQGAACDGCQSRQYCANPRIVSVANTSLKVHSQIWRHQLGQEFWCANRFRELLARR
jgi:hypothetical protein